MARGKNWNLNWNWNCLDFLPVLLVKYLVLWVQYENDLRNLKNHSIFFVIPRFSDVDVAIRNSRIKYWIHATKRGEALIFKRDDEDLGSEDPWLIRDISEIIKKHWIIYNHLIIRGQFNRIK